MTDDNINADVRSVAVNVSAPAVRHEENRNGGIVEVGVADDDQAMTVKIKVGAGREEVADIITSFVRSHIVNRREFCRRLAQHAPGSGGCNMTACLSLVDDTVSPEAHVAEVSVSMRITPCFEIPSGAAPDRASKSNTGRER